MGYGWIQAVSSSLTRWSRSRNRNGKCNNQTRFILLLGTLQCLCTRVQPQSMVVQDPSSTTELKNSIIQSAIKVQCGSGSDSDSWTFNCVPSDILLNDPVIRVKRHAHAKSKINGQYSSASSSSQESVALPWRRRLNSSTTTLMTPHTEGAETTTPFDRSLIPNSFFQVDTSGSGSFTSEKSSSQPPDLETAASSAERTRRSPYAYTNGNINREALHRRHPLPLPLPRPMAPRFRPLPPNPNVPQGHYHHHPHPFPQMSPFPPMAPMPMNQLQPPLNTAPVPMPAPSPVPVPMPMPYTQTAGGQTAASGTSGYDYTGYGYGYGSAPERQSSPSQYSRVKRPAPPSMHRRMPPPPRSRYPPPRGGPGQRARPGRPPYMPQAPQYSYPKNAANIQDILSYFKENDPPPNYDPLIRAPKPGPGMPLPFPADPSPPMKGGFSRELDDVQSSLLKDIREFAKRPGLMDNSVSVTPSPRRKPSSPSYTQSYNSGGEDEIFNPQPKPVRELAKHNGKNRYEDSIESQKSHRYSTRTKVGGRYGVRDSYEESKNGYRNPSKYMVDDSDERLPVRIREHDRDHREKKRNKLKYPSSYASRYPLTEELTNSEEWELYSERERGRSPSMHKPTANPIVLKRPYGPYRSEGEIKLTRPYQHYWDASGEREREREKDSYSGVPRVKAPSIMYSPSSKGNKSPLYYKNASPELVEDIVEIHTDPGYGRGRDRDRDRDRVETERERKARLQRMYLEYLERKLEAERQAAATIEAPPTTPKSSSNPMRMKIHIYPNENVKVASEPARGGSSYYYNPGPTVSYSNSNPTIVTAPTRREHYKQNNHNGHYMGSSSHRITADTSGPQMVVDKNKNVVLHLHVHRRQGYPGSGGMMAEASEIHTSTVKPLTYNEMFDTYQPLTHNHKGTSSSVDTDDKSVSMELPIQDEKIDDVLHTLLQLRQQ